MHDHLKQFHRQNPLLAGVSKEELRSRHLPGAPPWLMDALLARSKTLAAEGETVRLSSHKVALKQDEEDATDEDRDCLSRGRAGNARRCRKFSRNPALIPVARAPCSS